MNRDVLCAIAGTAIMAAFGGSAADASIVVNAGRVDTGAVALSGRNGSAMGPITDDPVFLSGTSATVSQTATAAAGPVLPIDPDNFSFPGTSGVAIASGTAMLAFAPNGAELVINALASASNNFVNMDGGGYLANASAYFRVDFTLDVPTAWTMTGVAGFNLQDPLANIRLVGPFGNYVNLVAADNGPFSFSGVLPAGAYLFEGFAAVGEVPIPSTGTFSENGGVSAELRLLPSPGAASLLALGAVVGLRRRR